VQDRFGCSAEWPRHARRRQRGHYLSGGGGDDALSGALGNVTYGFAGDFSLGLDASSKGLAAARIPSIFPAWSSDAGVYVDLGTISTLTKWLAGGQLHQVEFGLAINQIENAIGTDQGDTLIGNAHDNLLDGPRWR